VKTVTAVLALLLTTSCAVEELTLATSEGPPDGGHHPPPPLACTSNLDCRPEEYCAKVSCADATGGCMRRPTVCPSDLAPSCGCDTITYFNDCWRRLSGIAASTKGECETTIIDCGGSNPYMPCPKVIAGPLAGQMHCAQLLFDQSMCAPDIKGRCWVLPPQCDPNALGDVQRWMPCDGPGACVDTCTAIWNNGPHFPVPCP
jgi:hypothetical protein